MLQYIPYPSWLRPEIVPFLPIRWYGVMYLVAFAITYLLLKWQLRSRSLTVQKELVPDLFFWAILGVIVGGRLGFVLIYDTTGYFLKNPLQIILPFTRTNGKIALTGISGMSYHGGLVGASIAIIAFLKVKKLDVLDWADMLVAGIPLGYTFGRLGNFINGELYGRITMAGWGMLFPGVPEPGLFPARERWVQDFAASVGLPVPSQGLVNLPRHPSQLYEAFFEGFVLWLILWFIVRRRRPYKGFVLACYVLGYGVIRFFIEYTRQPDSGIGPGGHGFPIILQPLDNYLSQWSWFNFSTGQILNVIMMAAAFIMMAAFAARARRLESSPGPVPGAAPPTGRKLRKKLNQR